MTRLVPAVNAKSIADIEMEALNLTKRFYPKLLYEPGRFPVLDFFDHKLRDEFGLDPGVEELSQGIEGMTWPDGRVLLSEETYVGADGGHGRSRFTVIHECYHGIYHRSQIQKALVDTGELLLFRRTDIKPFLDPEWQANTFASALLMPRERVLAMAVGSARGSLEERIMDVFGVSYRAAEVRLTKLTIN